MTKRLDGVTLAKMLKNGYAALRLNENEINRLNVFPVADGDTGINMRLTLENGLRTAKPCAEVGRYLAALAEGVLLGARGNSGVILSQIIKGWSLELARTGEIGVGHLRNAFIRGYRQAYRSVARPVEGTILTVAREGIENIRTQIGRSTTVENLMSLYVAEMKKSLSFTPDILDVLKEAGVVDSGAMGYITIIEGMARYLYGETVEWKRGTSAKDAEAAKTEPERAAEAAVPDLSAFDENSVFEDGYCTEFLLQLMRGPQYLQNFRLDGYIKSLETLGSSIVAVQDGLRVKVHVHTHTPDRVIALSRQYGEFLTFKLENMQLQHNEQIKRGEEERDRGERVPFARVAAVDGDGLRELFEGLGCDRVVGVGPTMNVPAYEFLSALESLNADHIALLPNNKNTVSAAEQAASLYKGDAEITVVPTRSVIEGYCACAVDMPDEPDPAKRIKLMHDGVVNTHTLTVAPASKDYDGENVSARVGQTVAIVDSEIVCAADTPYEALARGLALLPDADDKEVCMAFCGDGSDDDVLASAVDSVLPDIELVPVPAGNTVYHWMIGLI